MELQSITFPGLPEPYSVAPASGFVAKNKVATVEALDAWIDELVASQEVATEKTYYCTLDYSSGLSLPYGRWSITIHKPDVGTDPALVGVTATVLTSGIIHRLRKEMYHAEWLPWEWETPPMVLGVEYRTTERWQGKAVYTALIDCGALPNNAQTATAHNVSMTKALRCSGTAGTSAIPRSHTVWPSTGKTVWTVDVCFSTTSVYIMTNFDASADNAYVQIWYTKD